MARLLRRPPDRPPSPALVGVAKLNRRRLTGTTFIGVTGSCGKSTTIALADGILSSAGKCTTVTGRSVTNAMDAVLRSNAATKFCMVETHGSFPGAIALSVAVLRPQIGVVTTIGGDHYSNYRSLEATAQEKGRLVESLPPSGVAVLNIDDPHVAGMAKRTEARLLTFGRSAEADLRASEVVSVWRGRLSLKAVYRGESVLVETKLLGEHWVTATLAGIGIGLACGLDLKTCAEVVGTVDPVFGRYTVHVRPDGAAYVLDSHKAPYWTIGEGLAFVKGVRAPRKTVVFGTISDYPGAASPRYRRIARAALEVADRVIVVGRHAGHIDKLRQGAVKDRLFGFETTYQVSAFLNGDQMAGELIYVKASITQHLERIMLSCLDEVVCWHERCGRKRPCIDCRHYRTPRRPPFGVVAAETAGHEPAAVETRAPL